MVRAELELSLCKLSQQDRINVQKDAPPFSFFRAPVFCLMTLIVRCWVGCVKCHIRQPLVHQLRCFESGSLLERHLSAYCKLSLFA